MSELWQLYDEQAKPLAGQGATKDEAYKGLLHGAAHVWIWRRAKDGVEVLLQKRASTKRTWPNLYDISAAGHIDLGETPEAAAVRETKEEIGMHITTEQLHFVDLHRLNMPTGAGDTENEFRWVYLVEMSGDFDFTLQTVEVESMTWKPLADFITEVHQPIHQYVPQGIDYYELVIEGIEKATA